MQQDKWGRLVSAKEWKKYNNAKIKCYGVDSTTDKELVDKT